MQNNIIEFPNPKYADHDGLLAFGGNLLPETLIAAYSNGIFPWTFDPITWWSPDPRGIFEIDNFKLSRRMLRLYKQKKFNITFNQNFTEVMRNCAKSAPGREETWISEEFIEAYTELHKLGYAHSVETNIDGKLVGGLYGVAIGGLFAGESMFYKVSNASTIAVASLVEHLKKQGFSLFDTQMVTEHTRRLGAIEIERSEYLIRLKKAMKSHCKFL